ncbi:ABC transporter B member 28 [Orobanche minor]
MVIGTLFLLFALSVQLAPVLGLLMLIVSVLVAVYKRTTVNVFKAHGSAQASIAECITETFAAIRTVRSFGGEKHQMSLFGRQVLEYESSGITLGVFKSINESLTRVAVYVSLMALYCLGGSKVKAGELAVGTMVSFIGYTFTLTFAYLKISNFFQVQGVVNTFGDLRGAFAATERINSVLSGAEIDEALAYALENDLKRRKLHDPNLEALLLNASNWEVQTRSKDYMSFLKSASDVRSLARSGDVCLEDGAMPASHSNDPASAHMQLFDMQQMKFPQSGCRIGTMANNETAHVPSALDSSTEIENSKECDWSEHVSPDGDLYYYNCVTCESRWEKPEEYVDYEEELDRLEEQQHQLQDPKLQLTALYFS